MNNLSAIAGKDSDSELVISWSAPEGYSEAHISQYYVRVTNYSLDLVAAKTVPANTTSINITGLGQLFMGTSRLLITILLDYLHLGPFIPYNITVIAWFKIGNGPPNSILNFTRQGGTFDHHDYHNNIAVIK